LIIEGERRIAREANTKGTHVRGGVGKGDQGERGRGTNARGTHVRGMQDSKETRVVTCDGARGGGRDTSTWKQAHSPHDWRLTTPKRQSPPPTGDGEERPLLPTTLSGSGGSVGIAAHSARWCASACALFAIVSGVGWLAGWCDCVRWLRGWMVEVAGRRDSVKVVKGARVG